MTENERKIKALELENKKLKKALTNAEVKSFSLIHLKDKPHETK